MIRLASTVPRFWTFWDPAAAITTPTPLSQPEDHRVPALLLLRSIVGSLAILRHPSAKFRGILSLVLIRRIATDSRFHRLVVHHLRDGLAILTRN